MNRIQIIALFMAVGLIIGLTHEKNAFADYSQRTQKKSIKKDQKSRNRRNKRYQNNKNQPEKKKCSRGRRFGWGFLGGGATGGLIAGLAGSAKWTPLGIVAGGLVGGAIAASTAKDCEE